MKQLPDILTSTTFWSAVLTIWAAVGAWFTFIAAARASRNQTHADIMNLLAGIEAELDLVSLWANGHENSGGYLQEHDKEKLAKGHPDWFNPSRQIFTFDTPSLQSFTASAQLRHLSEIVRPLVRLNYSVRRVFDLHSELRTFVNSHPELYDQVCKKLSEVPNVFTSEEKVYMNIVFGFNLRIHQQLIGGKDSTDDLCLYHAFRTAQRKVEEFKAHAHPERLPNWYWLLHVSAVLFAVLGAWEVGRWLMP